ncbi:hypothetical protein [Cupriavidus basilensis]|uniref:hypothetical protein n=1 Tax=Cupriavidus basilensis TaxID=68895 RepID=UPI0039F6E78A
MHTQFSADLKRTREQVVVAQERASATERRALREIDQERTLRQKAEQALERAQVAQDGLRAELEAALRQADHARAEAERDALQTTNRAQARAARESLTVDLAKLTAQFDAQAQLLADHRLRAGAAG